MPEIRPLANPFMEGIATVLESIQLGPTNMEVGRGEAPDCEPPYLMISMAPGGTFTGPFSDPEADWEARVTVVGVGVSQEMALAALDEARKTLTRDNLTPQIPGRRVMRCWLDISRPEVREERGLPDPLFSAVDQYMIETTPST